MHRDTEAREGFFKLQSYLKRPLARLRIIEEPRVTHQGCGLSLAVLLTPKQRVCRHEQFVLAAFLSSPVLLRVRREQTRVSL